ncbi:MAG: hypothetical protein U0174_10515 [Polyangiaceae bacterium]
MAHMRRLLLVLAGSAFMAAACVVAEQPTIGYFNTFTSGSAASPIIDAGAPQTCEGGAPVQSGEGGACGVSFATNIVPILSTNCSGCHSGGQNTQIVFPTTAGPAYYESLTKATIAAQAGVYLNACDPAKSGFPCNVGAASCSPAGVAMPPNTPLSEADKAAINAWIKCGAPNN